MTIHNDARLLLGYSNARMICAPEELKAEGFSPDLVDAVTTIMESNPTEPKETIWAPDGRMLNQLRGVVVLDLAVEIAKRLNLTYEESRGWQRQLANIQDAINESVGRSQEST